MSNPATDPVRHVHVRANGIDFHVALCGREDAPLLLCLHGFPECWYSWRHQLARLSDRFLVAAPDLRGYGETEKPGGGYELENLAADAAGLIPALGRKSATLVGHDWGGFIAYATAARHPDVLDHLVVMNCPHPAAITGRLPSLDQLRRSWYLFAIQIPGLFDWRLSRDDAAIIPRLFKAGAKHRSAFSDGDLAVLRTSFARPGVVKAALAYYRSNLSLFALLRGRMRTPPIRTPTTVLCGRDDPFVGPGLFRDHERHFQGSYEIRHLDCGHWTQQEVPDLVNDTLAGLLPSAHGSPR